MRRFVIAILTGLVASLGALILAAQAQDEGVAGESLTQSERPGEYAVVRPGVALTFPRDHGAHPSFRTEWWYVTGCLTIAEGDRTGEELGFQVTFFRSAPSPDAENPSRFAPNQILFAHAAVSDPSIGSLLHGEASAREGFGIAGASTEDADVTLRGWTFERREDGTFETYVKTEDFSFTFAFDPTQPVFEQGERGYSQKGPSPEEASYYYSLPHLAVSGALSLAGDEVEVSGKAWLDREWSSNLLTPGAVGWDWAGINFDDGGAMIAFQIRDAEGGALWAGGSYRAPDGTITRFAPDHVSFETVRTWISPRTEAVYPVEQVLVVDLPSGTRRLPLEPMFDDQELDGRGSGMPVYWEGAVTTTGGRGYLEMTGYAGDLQL